MRRIAGTQEGEALFEYLEENFADVVDALIHARPELVVPLQVEARFCKEFSEYLVPRKA